MRLLNKITVIDALSALNATGVLRQNELSNAHFLTYYIIFSAGSSAGEVTVESAHDPDFTGTWSKESVIAWTAANKVFKVTITDPGNGGRVRISDAIVGGTVTVIATIKG